MHNPRIYIAIATFHPLIGGAEKQALMQGRCLRARGFEATVLTFHHDPSWPKREEIEGVPVIRVSGSILHKRDQLPRPLQKLLYLLAMIIMGWSVWRHRHNFDILHVYQLNIIALPTAFACWLAHKAMIVAIRCIGSETPFSAHQSLLAGPLNPHLPCLHIPGRFIAGNDLEDLERLGKPIVRLTHVLLLRIRAVVLVLSSRMQNYPAAHDFPLPNIQLIPNGVDLTCFHPQKLMEHNEQNKYRSIVGTGDGVPCEQCHLKKEHHLHEERRTPARGPSATPLFPRPYYDDLATTESDIVGTGAVRMEGGAPRGRPSSPHHTSFLFEQYCPCRLPSTSQTVVCIARLSYEKGVDVLLQAWNLVHREESQAHLLIVGDGPLQSQLLAMTEALGLSQSVTFAGAQRDIPAQLYRGSFAVLPSRREGMPNAVLEAMACGKPCVATRAGGSEDIIQHETNGLLVEVGDYQAMAQAILTLLRDPERTHRYGQAARKRIEQAYSLEHITDMYIALYQHIFQSRALNIQRKKATQQCVE